jgi:hypothetical protein
MITAVAQRAVIADSFIDNIEAITHKTNEEENLNDDSVF